MELIEMIKMCEEKRFVEIPIRSRGLIMKIDEEDLDLLQGRSVYLTGGYPAIWLDGKNQKVHRLIMKDLLEQNPDKPEIDHINGKKLDNRKSNLRLCNHNENIQNRRKQKGNYSSSFKGVCWRNDSKKWRAYININGKRKSLGCFNTELEAAEAYNQACEKYHNDFAKPNLINELLDKIVDKLNKVNISIDLKSE